MFLEKVRAGCQDGKRIERKFKKYLWVSRESVTMMARTEAEQSWRGKLLRVASPRVLPLFHKQGQQVKRIVRFIV